MPPVLGHLKRYRARFGVGAPSLVLLLLVGTGLLLSNTHAASVIASNARALHWTNATKGSAAIARASTAQAVFFSFEDLSDPTAKELALEEARANIDAVRSAATAEHADDATAAALNDFVTDVEHIVALAESGQAAEAESQRTTTAEESFRHALDLLETQQGRLLESISDSDRTSDQISQITFVVIAFMVPAITIMAFWLVLRRKLRVRESEMEAQLEAERQLNRTKDELIAGMSHELRTPLTTIYGFSEILLQDPSIEGEAHELLSLINSSSSDLTRMVNDLLTAARLDADALTTNLGHVDISKEVATVAEPYLRSGERLKVEVPRLLVYSDPLHVRQIVHNLISNAIRHGGEEIVVSAVRKKTKVVLVVTDNGPGIPETMESQLFKRFAHKGRSAVVEGSVGLGLAISHELARNLGGSLRYSRVDGWTTFKLNLPALLSKEDIYIELSEAPLGPR